MNDKTLSSSQESLPLSQETLNTLLQMINTPGKIDFSDDLKDIPDWSSLIDVPIPGTLPPECSSSIFPHAFNSHSSLPATSNCPGEYSFKVSFGNEEKNKSTKHINWTYSETDNKLYVKKDTSCPFNFSTDRIMSPDCTVRAMAVYSAPEHIAHPVTRCLNHSKPEIEQGVFQAEHLIRSESVFASYYIDAKSKRHSVVVPFENPPAGQEFSTYIYKFFCFSSCSGGPNRRLLTLIFTLEQGNTVLGRHSMELKICACPGRDREEAEKKLQKLQAGPSTSNVVKKIKASEDTNPGPSTKKVKSESKKKKLIIEAENEECYLYLMKMKNLYKLYRGVKDSNNLPSDLKAMICVFRSSSSDEDDKS